MWEFFEQLLSQLPNRSEMTQTVSGAIDRALSSIRSKLTTLTQSVEVRNANDSERVDQQSDSTPDRSTQQIIDDSRAKLDRMREMLESLGRDDNSPVTIDDQPKHVIVDNAEDIKDVPEQSQSTRQESPDNSLKSALDKLSEMQSPEWKAKTQAEQDRAYQERFGGPPEMVEYVDQFPKDKQQEARDAWWEREIRNRLDKPQPQQPPQQPQQPQPQPLRPRRPQRTVSKWMASTGRRFQIWAGRLSGIGGGRSRVIGMAARGLSRAGMAMEGLGVAGTVGPLGATIGAVVAGLSMVPVALASFVKASQSAGDGLLEQQRRYMGFSVGQSQAGAIDQISKLQTDLKTAQGTEYRTIELAKQMAELREAMQPIDQLVTNIELAVVAKLVDASTQIVNSVKGFVSSIEAISLKLIDAQIDATVKDKVAADLLKNGARIGFGMAADALMNHPAPNGMPIDQAFRNIRDWGPPAVKGRPPIPPVK